VLEQAWAPVLEQVWVLASNLHPRRHRMMQVEAPRSKPRQV
jgi:hypothetical protein